MELAYDVKYLLDKHGVSKQSYRHIALWNSDGSRISRSDGGIYVQEVGFVQADLGGETWDASVVLARKIARGSVDVSKHKRCIELGCGTGLLGFTVAHVFAGSSGEYSDGAPKSDRVVVMTDYLPVIIDAVEEGAEKNGLFDLAGLVRPALLDWFDMAEQAQLMKDRARVPLPGTNYLSESEINIMPSNKANGCANINRLDPTECEGFFDLVVAADVLYEVEQCLVIPRLVDFLLTPAPEHSSGNDGLTTIPKFIVTTSLRSTHWAEVDAFEAEMAKISGLMLVSKVDSSRLSDVAEWLETLIDSHCADVTWIEAKQDEDDSRQYRTYVFERQRLA
ncbi:hypothetical protein LPJ81_002915 [Coemansia sp. IMI 209127]|nr:hypothetical protein LPJ81_002915 [Coemansia sp. IMI 209127]